MYFFQVRWGLEGVISGSLQYTTTPLRPCGWLRTFAAPVGGVLPYKSDGGARRKISRTPLQGTRILFYGRVPNSSPPLRGTNSTTTNNIIGTANFNNNKDNFRKLSSQGLFESIVINVYPYKAYQLWQQSF